MNEFAFVYAALAVGLVWLFVTLWEARVAKTSIDTVGKNPELNDELKGLTILGIALVESAAIYALLVAILITFTDGVSATKAMAAMFAVVLPGMLAGVGEAAIVVSAIKAIQRLVFGLNFQERALIFAEKPENVQAAINNFKALYADYNTLWIEVKKEVKTLKLPSIGQISVPEYTLPGGRSRWFRYLYKNGSG